MNHMVILCLTFCFPQWLYHFTLPHAMYKGSNFSTSLPALVILYLKNESHPGGCEVVSHCGFHVHSPNDWECWASFHVLVGHLYVFLGEMSIQVLLNWDVCFFCCFTVRIPYILWTLDSYMTCKYFLPLCWLSFLHNILRCTKVLNFDEV